MPRKAKNVDKEEDLKLVLDKNAVKLKLEEDDDMPTAEQIEKWNILGIKLLDKEEISKLKNAKFKQYCLHIQRWNNCLETQLQFEEYKLKLLMDYHNGMIEQNNAIDEHRKDCKECLEKTEGKIGKELVKLDIQIKESCKQIESMKSSYDEKRAKHKIKCAELEKKMNATKKRVRKKPQPKKNANKKFVSDSETDDELRNSKDKNDSKKGKDWVKSESETDMESNDGFKSKTKKNLKSESDEEMDTDLDRKKKLKSESDSDSADNKKHFKKEVKSETDYSSEDEKDIKKDIKLKEDYESDDEFDEKQLKKEVKQELKVEAKPNMKKKSPVRGRGRPRK